MPIVLHDIYGSEAFFLKDESGNIVHNERAANDDLRQPVILQNDSAVPFGGKAAMVAGIDHSLAPGEEEHTSIDVVYAILGNPFYARNAKDWSKYRKRLMSRFGARPTPMMPDPDDAAFMAQREKYGRPVEWDDRMRHLPTLRVLDPKTREEFTPMPGWPLYEEEPRQGVTAEFVARATAEDLADLKSEVESLKKLQKA
jgi:hypothetical protein